MEGHEMECDDASTSVASQSGAGPQHDDGSDMDMDIGSDSDCDDTECFYIVDRARRADSTGTVHL